MLYLEHSSYTRTKRPRLPHLASLCNIQITSKSPKTRSVVPMPAHITHIQYGMRSLFLALAEKKFPLVPVNYNAPVKNDQFPLNEPSLRW